jgi:hypothetical protein
VAVKPIPIPTAPHTASKTVVHHDPGGLITAHAIRWRAIAEQGGEVDILGLCGSACTLAVAFVPKEKLCFGELAVLYFHQARHADGRPPLDSTQWMMNRYPDDQGQWIPLWLRPCWLRSLSSEAVHPPSSAFALYRPSRVQLTLSSLPSHPRRHYRFHVVRRERANIFVVNRQTYETYRFTIGDDVAVAHVGPPSDLSEARKAIVRIEQHLTQRDENDSGVMGLCRREGSMMNSRRGRSRSDTARAACYQKVGIVRWLWASMNARVPLVKSRPSRWATSRILAAMFSETSRAHPSSAFSATTRTGRSY